jgi:hypothetical protein
MLGLMCFSSKVISDTLSAGKALFSSEWSLTVGPVVHAPARMHSFGLSVVPGACMCAYVLGSGLGLMEEVVLSTMYFLSADISVWFVDLVTRVTFHSKDVLPAYNS